jgi:hypothetical protein
MRCIARTRTSTSTVALVEAARRSHEVSGALGQKRTGGRQVQLLTLCVADPLLPLCLGQERVRGETPAADEEDVELGDWGQSGMCARCQIVEAKGMCAEDMTHSRRWRSAGSAGRPTWPQPPSWTRAKDRSGLQRGRGEVMTSSDSWSGAEPTRTNLAPRT